MTDATDTTDTGLVKTQTRTQTITPATAYIAKMTTRVSRASAASALKALARTLGQEDPSAVPWHKLGYAETSLIRNALVQKYAPGSARAYIGALKGILHQCARMGLMSYEELSRATDLERIRGTRLPAGRMITEQEEAQLFSACASLPSPQRERDAAMLAVGLSTGLRRAEIASARIEKLDVSTRGLTIIGKGNKERVVFIPERAFEVLTAWLRVRGGAPGPLFTPFVRGPAGNPAVVLSRYMAPGSVWRILRGVFDTSSTKFVPHDLRRTCISRMFESGVDPSAIQHNAGHASLNTTARYDRRGEKALSVATSKSDIHATVILPNGKKTG